MEHTPEMALDDTFWAASTVVHGVRKMHCVHNANGEVILCPLTKEFGVE